MRDGAHVVEVGAFLGKSTACLAVEIVRSGKRIQLDTIDTFTGVPEAEWLRSVAPADRFTFADQEALRDGDGSLVTAARRYLAPVLDRVQLIVGDSLTQAATYADASLDFVYLDDNHETAHVRAELDAWWPKLKPGGVLAGHDFDWPSVQKAVVIWGVRTGLVIANASARSWTCTKPQPADTWLVPPRQRKCLVAVCCNERTIPRHTAESLCRIGWGQRVTDAATKYQFTDVSFAWFSRYLSVADLRDEAAYVALSTGCSHVLYLDADMIWPTDVLDRMLAHHGHGLVSGLYHLKAWPHWPVALRTPVWNAVDQQFDYTYDKPAPHTDALRAESLVGMGCTIVPVELFRRFARPWFHYTVNAAGMATITEDVYFCQQAARVGCPIWLDPTVDCGHVSQQPITSAWYDRATVEMVMLANGQRITKRDEAPVTIPPPRLSLVEP